MTRGRYAARAANREARLDNDVIREKVNEVAALKAKVADLEAMLAVERQDRDALVVRRADELSAEQIQKAHQAINRLRADQRESDRETAEQVAEVIRRFIVATGDSVRIPVD